MIEIGGVYYYIDLAALDKTITPLGSVPTDLITIAETKTTTTHNGESVVEVTKTTSPRGKEIDGAKYDVIRVCLEVLVDYDDETDDSLGVERGLAKTPLAYKIAFNTLYNYGILKEKE
jgi:hypothetical protein